MGTRIPCPYDYPNNCSCNTCKSDRRAEGRARNGGGRRGRGRRTRDTLGSALIGATAAAGFLTSEPESLTTDDLGDAHDIQIERYRAEGMSDGSNRRGRPGSGQRR